MARTMLARLLGLTPPIPQTMSLGVHMQDTATATVTPPPPARPGKAKPSPDLPGLPDAADLAPPAPDPVLSHEHKRLAFALKHFRPESYAEGAAEKVRQAEAAWNEARRTGDEPQIREAFTVLAMAREALDPVKAHRDLWHREAVAYRALLADMQAKCAPVLEETTRRLAIVEPERQRLEAELARVAGLAGALRRRQAVLTRAMRHR